jgi:hypothetical protein
MCINILGLMLASLATPGSDKEKHVERPALTVPSTPIGLAVFLSDIDGGAGQVFINNSRVVVNTPTVDAVIRKGLVCIPTLVSIMKDDGVPDDLFIRCYSSCDQILAAINPSLSIVWEGGARSEKVGNRRRLRLGFDFIAEDGFADFKKEVIADIEKKMPSPPSRK